MNLTNQIKSIFVDESQIPAEFQIKELHQREYLTGGEMKQWDGELNEVYSPVYLQGPDGLKRKLIGSYPVCTENEAMEALHAALKAYDNGRGQWPTMSVTDRIKCLERFIFKMSEQRSIVVKLLMWEIGKSYGDSAKEFDRTIEYINNTIDELKDMDRHSSRFEIAEGLMAQIRRSPLGVVLCMGPFNYPLNETFTTLIPDLVSFEDLLAGDDMAYISDTFYGIFGEVADDIVIRSMLAVGNYRVYIGPSYFGNLYFFGKGEKWNRVLTTKDDDRVKNVLNEYFNLIRLSSKDNIEEKLTELAQTGLLANRAPWIKLFLKYPGITQTSHNIFAIRDTDSFEIVRLGSTSLRGYHVNSIIQEVIKSGRLVVEPKNNGWASDSEESYISLKYSSYMLPRGDHWMIDARSQDFSPLAKEFGLEQIGDTNQFKLFPGPEKDMVEIGIDIYNAIYK
jgi:hypothetical protein